MAIILQESCGLVSFLIALPFVMVLYKVAFCPFLFGIYIDELSSQLQSKNIGCRLSNIIVNHLLFADDAVIFAPSAKGLQQLLDICSEFAATHNVVFSVKKSQCLIVASKNNVITRPFSALWSWITIC